MGKEGVAHPDLGNGRRDWQLALAGAGNLGGLSLLFNYVHIKAFLGVGFGVNVI